jgi:hypothetical protein
MYILDKLNDISFVYVSYVYYVSYVSYASYTAPGYASDRIAPAG